MKSLALLALPFASSILGASGSLVDGAAIEVGNSPSSYCDVTMVRVSLLKDWKQDWIQRDSWHVGSHWELGLGYWNNTSEARTSSSMLEVDLTPVFRLEGNRTTGVSPYLEAAVGIHLFNHSGVSEFRQFGSSFSFGDHIGMGLRFGPNQCFDLAYRFQHLSNAGLADPNKGINFQMLRFGTRF